MCPSGETQDADAVWIDVPFVGVGTYHAEGALSILKRGGRLRVRAGLRYAVFDQDAGDAGGVQPVADFGTFEVDGEDTVTASGKYNDRGTGVVGPGV